MDYGLLAMCGDVVAADINGDDDVDLALPTEGGFAWLENADGLATTWVSQEVVFNTGVPSWGGSASTSRVTATRISS